MNSDRPWMTALEMQFATLGTVRKLRAMPDVPSGCTDDHVIGYMARSIPFSWSRETSSAVWLASKTIPMDAQFEDDLLPDGMTSAFWWLDEPIPLPMKYKASTPDDFNDIDTNRVCALLLSRVEGTWTVSCGRMSTLGVPCMMEINVFRYGTSLTELTQPDAQRYDLRLGRLSTVLGRDLSLVRFILAASVWLKQRIVTTSLGPVERHRRKQLAREHDVPLISDVKVIQLRRTESQPQQPGHESEVVDWSCRWIVGGHWRNQPYKDEHKLIYILPYVKGPDDKPLKVPTHTVYQVSR